MWRTAVYAKVAVVLCSLALGLGLGVPVAAEDNTVTAQVCQPDAAGQLSITAPQSDTVVRQAAVELSGDVELINQVEAYVDGSFRKVTAIASGQTTFSMTIPIPEGTHTIEVRGNQICNGEEMRDEVVVTYEAPSSPAAPTRPSVGSETPTVTNPTPGSGGVVVSNPNPSEDTNSEEQNWLQRLVDWLTTNGLTSWMVEFTDSDMTAKRLPVDGLRIGVFVAGLILTLGAGPLVRLLPPYAAGAWSMSRQRAIRYGVRGIGLCLVVVSLLFWL